jgi:DHA2 family methylenomycin A resistance protein-like MFS transporter
MGSVGVALGPVIGGALVALAGWRSIFLVNVPICVLTVFGAPAARHRVATQPGRGWISPLPAALFAAGLVAGWFFVRAERGGASPMLPLALFRSRSLSGATGIGAIFNLVLYGSLLCLSLYLQQARHQSVLAAGLLLLPMSVLVGVGSLAMPAMTAVAVGAAGPEHAGVAGAS